MKFKVFSKIRFFFLIYSVMIFSACHDSDKIEPEYGERTVLIYMAADNNLNKDGETNIKVSSINSIYPLVSDSRTL